MSDMSLASVAPGAIDVEEHPMARASNKIDVSLELGKKGTSAVAHGVN